MNTKIENALDDFYTEEEQVKNSVNIKVDKNNYRKNVLNERDGLIERIDKTFVTSDGRQLLREVY